MDYVLVIALHSTWCNKRHSLIFVSSPPISLFLSPLVSLHYLSGAMQPISTESTERPKVALRLRSRAVTESQLFILGSGHISQISLGTPSAFMQSCLITVFVVLRYAYELWIIVVFPTAQLLVPAFK